MTKTFGQLFVEIKETRDFLYGNKEIMCLSPKLPTAADRITWLDDFRELVETRSTGKEPWWPVFDERIDHERFHGTAVLHKAGWFALDRAADSLALEYIPDNSHTPEEVDEVITAPEGGMSLHDLYALYLHSLQYPYVFEE